MNRLAIIGGSGLTQFADLKILDKINPDTPWGKPSAPIIVGKYDDNNIVFLPRHGNPHTIPPHEINYRANIWALKEFGIDNIIAINAVGGITEGMTPCRMVIPNQLIDYTYGRANSFYEPHLKEIPHIDFTEPYSRALRDKLIITTKMMDHEEIYTIATYAVTQGPRLETAAEIRRLEKDGCHIVGMTGMPEASLARELNIEYACCALVVNQAAGKTDEIITKVMIENNLKHGIKKVIKLLVLFLHERQ